MLNNDWTPLLKRTKLHKSNQNIREIIKYEYVKVQKGQFAKERYENMPTISHFYLSRRHSQQICALCTIPGRLVLQVSCLHRINVKKPIKDDYRRRIEAHLN